METWESGILNYDKMELKRNYAEKGICVVPPVAARYGAILLIF
jgi:2,3,4,5-tetrahydropyridine-2-carboxylate N-succinyltransferase